MGRCWNLALRAPAWLLLAACSARPAASSEAAAGLLPDAAAPADAGLAAAAPSCAEPTGCPTSPAAGAEGCLSAQPLSVAQLTERAVLVAAGTTRGALDSSQSEYGSCAGASGGPDAWYRLDLSSASGPLELHAAVDAAFDVAVDLRRGACGDTRSIACDRAAPVGRASSMVAARVDPGVYWLVVDGANETSAGEFRLQVEVDPDLGCSAPPPNQSCEAAAQLEPLERQTVLIDEPCAVAAGIEGSLFYELDLSTEALPVVAQVAVWNLSGRDAELLRIHELAGGLPGCGAQLAFSYFGGGGEQTSSVAAQGLLAPGRYVIELQPRDVREDAQLALTVQLDRETCAAGPVGNDCAEALDIDVTVTSQVIAGSTLCNTSRHTLLRCVGESDVAPEQFHRLDLRAAAGSTRVHVTTLVDGLGFEPLLSLFTADASGGCGDPLHCDDRIWEAEGPPYLRLTLAPGLYFIGVDGINPGAAGTYRLLVELEPGEPSPCVTAQIQDCMLQSPLSSDCCGEWSPLCSQRMAACGLSEATQACVCTTQPACCESGLLQPDCSATRQACSYLCADFAPSENSCWGAGG